MASDLYRRHIKTCPFSHLGINYSRCTCPVWVDMPHPTTGKRLRRSIGTRDWGRAMRLLEQWETSTPKPGDAPQIGIGIRKAIEEYLKDCRSRHLNPNTIRNYENTLAHFQRLCTAPEVSEITILTIRDFRNVRAAEPGRKSELTSARSQRKELEHLRAFCEFCLVSDWLKTNPARKVKPPKDDTPPTMPFTPEQTKAILAACDRIDNPNQREIPRARVRARALALLLLYSGLRISDAVKLERFRIDKTGRLLLRMEKTKEPLYVRLPADCLAALKAVPVESEYYFWSGTAALSTAVGSARRTIACLMRLAQIKGRPHMFRDTFSVELLKAGVDLRTVQKLLGHTSIKTTEKHYAPWVREFQQRLDRATSKLKFG